MKVCFLGNHSEKTFCKNDMRNIELERLYLKVWALEGKFEINRVGQREWGDIESQN